MRAVRRRGACVVFATCFAMASGYVPGGEVEVPHWVEAGRLSWLPVPTGVSYRVEWRPTVSSSWQSVSAMESLESLTCSPGASISVPMHYRVMATVTNAGNAAPSGMVRIPAGGNSGSNPIAPGESNRADYPATYSLVLSAPLFMDACEVTKGLWDRVASWAVTNGYDITPSTGLAKGTGHPVYGVTLWSAIKWCNARSEQEGLTPVYGSVYRKAGDAFTINTSRNGYRLPVSTEWEYAARGGMQGRRYPWGDTLSHAQANYHSYGAGQSGFYPYDASETRGYHPLHVSGTAPFTSPAGIFAANGYGLHDMAGNVREWCVDPAGGGSYVHTKGGAWDLNSCDLRCGVRIGQYPQTAFNNLGFRTVRRVP